MCRTSMQWPRPWESHSSLSTWSHSTPYVTLVHCFVPLARAWGRHIDDRSLQRAYNMLLKDPLSDLLVHNCGSNNHLIVATCIGGLCTDAIDSHTQD